jgi:hypothetical protein
MVVGCLCRLVAYFCDIFLVGSDHTHTIDRCGNYIV